MPTVAPTSTPIPGIPTHIATWAYDEYLGQGSAGTAAQAQTYLTYAEAGFGNLKAVKDCAGSNACSSVYYFDPNYVYHNGDCTGVYEQTLFAAANESWFLHHSGFSDTTHRLIGHRNLDCHGVKVAQPVYGLDHYNPDVRAFIENYLRTYADSFDYIFLDETSSHIITQLYGPGGGMCADNPPWHLCSTTQEYPDDASLLQGHHLLFSNLTHSNGSLMRLFFNPLTLDQGKATDLDLIATNTNVFGGMCEDCVVSLGKFRPDDYVAVLDAMAQVNAIPGAQFIQLNIGNDPVGSDQLTGERNVMAAMTWLGYSPGHTVAFPDLEYGSNDLAIWPEYSIVPMNPVESMSTSFQDIQVSTSPRVYRREFRTCYNFGVPIGQCAAIVNGGGSQSITVSASWLQLNYGHVIQFSGGDIPSGGTVLLNSTPFVPSQTTIAPGHGILLAR